MRFAAACALVALGSACSRRDNTPPAITASPEEGLYGSAETVTLTTDEAATIHYSTDGEAPAPGAANTTSGRSPLQVVLREGKTVLKCFAIDLAGNASAVQTRTYVVDLFAPVVTITPDSPSPMGILSTQMLTWQSSEAGVYAVALDSPGNPATLAKGLVSAATPMQQLIDGDMVLYSTVRLLWISVTDAAGHTGSASVALRPKPQVAIDVGYPGSIAILPDGSKTYVASGGGPRSGLVVIDTDPGSPQLDTVIASVPLGGRPADLAMTPDGRRIYATIPGATGDDFGRIAAIDTASDTELAAIQLDNDPSPSGIAITPDGTRAYVLSFAGEISVLDVDPASQAYHSVIAGIPRAQLESGRIAIAPDGTRAILNWQGVNVHGVDVVDVDPASPTYDTIVASPVAAVTGPYADVAVSADGQFAYATDAQNLLFRFNLRTSSVDATGLPTLTLRRSPFALTPDGSTLLVGQNYLQLVVLKSDLKTVVEVVTLADTLGGPGAIAVTPDGTRAYLDEAVVDLAPKVVMVPLK